MNTIAVMNTKKGLKSVPLDRIKLSENMATTTVNHIQKGMKIIYHPNTPSTWVNKLASKFMNRVIYGASIIYIDGKILSPRRLVKIYDDMMNKPSWASFAEKITVDDSKKLQEEAKVREDHRQAVISAKQREEARLKAIEAGDLVEDDDYFQYDESDMEAFYADAERIMCENENSY